MGIGISSRDYVRAIKAVFAIGCFAGLLKLLAGSAALLVSDALMFGLVFFFHPEPEAGAAKPAGPAMKLALCLSAALLALGFCQSFNPNVPNPSTGLFYYRISSYPIFCIFIGYKMLRIPSRAPEVFDFIFRVCTPINALYALVQSFRLDPLSIRLVKHLGWGQFGTLGTYRVTGFFQGPVQLGLLCGMGAGIMLIRNIYHERLTLKKLAMLLILAASLIASMSRASLLGFLSFVLVASLFLLPRLKRRPQMASFIMHFAFLSLLPVAAILYIGDLETIDVLTSRIETLGNIDQDNSFRDGRINNWKYKVVPALLRSPLGRGNGSTGTVRPDDEAPYAQRILETESLYFSLTMELGWLGLALALPIFLMSVAGAMILVKDNHAPPAIEAAAVIWIFAFAGITSPNMSAYPVTWLFFFSFPPALAALDRKLASLALKLPSKGFAL
jgi:hypothetical protein